MITLFFYVTLDQSLYRRSDQATVPSYEDSTVSYQHTMQLECFVKVQALEHN